MTTLLVGLVYNYTTVERRGRGRAGSIGNPDLALKTNKNL